MLFMCVRYILGTILAIAAVLKLRMLLTDPFADLESGFSIQFLWLAVFAEGTVATINYRIRKVSNFVAANTNLALFSILLCISIEKWSRGIESCGCLGEISLPVLVVMLFDASVIFVQAIYVIREYKHVASKSKLQFVDLWQTDRLVRFAGIAVGVIFAIFSALTIQHYNETTDRFRAGRINAEIVGQEMLSTKKAASYVLQISNRSEFPVKIVGVALSCNCLSLEGSLSVLPPHTVRSVNLSVTPVSTGRFHQRVVFFLACPEHAVLVSDIAGLVQE